MEEEIKQLKQRLGKEGFSELAKLDTMGMSLLNRMYLISSIAANIHIFDEGLAQEFYNSQTGNINHLQDELDKLMHAFTRKRGEI